MHPRRAAEIVLLAAACSGLSGAAPAEGPPAEAPRKGPAPPFWTYEDFQAGRIPQDYTVRKGHPRLLITPENRPEMVAKAKAAPKLFQRAITQADKGSGPGVIVACGAIHQLGAIPGFKYAMAPEEYGRKGVKLLMSVVRARNAEVTWKYDKLRLSVPCGYDWLYPLLTASQRKAIVSELIRLAGDAGSTAKTVRLSGANAPAGLQRMTMGLAFHGDGVDDPAAKRIVDSTFKQIWWNADKGRTWPSVLQMVLLLEGGGWTEGANYFGFNYKCFPDVAAWKTATGQDYFARMGYFRAIPYWMAHAVLPNMPPPRKGGYLKPEVLPVGRYHARGVSPVRILASATGYLSQADPVGASLAKWWIKRYPGGGWFNSPGLVSGVLIGDPRVKLRSPAELKLPRTLVMRGLNLVFMRSAWGDPDATVVGFGNNRFHTYRSETHNALCLWKNGGHLFPYRGYAAGHYYYQHRAVPDNNVVYYKGGDVIVVPHVTGVTMPPRKIVGSALEIGTLVVHSVPGQIDYIVGECGKGFAGQLVKRSERTLVYLRSDRGSRSDYLVVRDRTETKSPEIVPHVVFQSVLEPKVGPDWRTEQTGQAVLPGQWRIDDSPCVTITNDHAYKNRAKPRAHARAFLRTLVPKSTSVIKVGGEGHAMDDLEGKAATKRPWGDIGGSKASLAARIAHAGLWRFHVVPKAKATKHLFLHAIEATDSKVTRPGVIALLKGTGAIGVQIGPNVVLFSEDDGPLSSATVTVAAQTTRIVIGDLKPGAGYSVVAGKKTTAAVASSAGSLLVNDVRLAPGQSVQITSSAKAPQGREGSE